MDFPFLLHTTPHLGVIQFTQKQELIMLMAQDSLPFLTLKANLKKTMMFGICVRISDHSKMAGSFSSMDVTHNVNVDDDSALDDLLSNYAKKVKK